MSVSQGFVSLREELIAMAQRSYMVSHYTHWSLALSCIAIPISFADGIAGVDWNRCMVRPRTGDAAPLTIANVAFCHFIGPSLHYHIIKAKVVPVFGYVFNVAKVYRV